MLRTTPYSPFLSLTGFPLLRMGSALCALVIVIGVFSLGSDPAALKYAAHFKIWDKFLHAGTYGAFAFFLCFALGTKGFRLLVLAILGTALFGLLDEWHQVYTPGRTADIMDWYADLAGAVGGSVIAALSLVWVSRLKQIPLASVPPVLLLGPGPQQAQAPALQGGVSEPMTALLGVSALPSGRGECQEA